mgnify:CR=1 FL=1
MTTQPSEDSFQQPSQHSEDALLRQDAAVARDVTTMHSSFQRRSQPVHPQHQQSVFLASGEEGDPAASNCTEPDDYPPRHRRPPDHHHHHHADNAAAGVSSFLAFPGSYSAQGFGFLPQSAEASRLHDGSHHHSDVPSALATHKQYRQSGGAEPQQQQPAAANVGRGACDDDDDDDVIARALVATLRQAALMADEDFTASSAEAAEVKMDDPWRRPVAAQTPTSADHHHHHSAVHSSHDEAHRSVNATAPAVCWAASPMATATAPPLLPHSGRRQLSSHVSTTSYVAAAAVTDHQPPYSSVVTLTKPLVAHHHAGNGGANVPVATPCPVGHFQTPSPSASISNSTTTTTMDAFDVSRTPHYLAAFQAAYPPPKYHCLFVQGLSESVSASDALCKLFFPWGALAAIVDDRPVSVMGYHQQPLGGGAGGGGAGGVFHPNNPSSSSTSSLSGNSHLHHHLPAATAASMPHPQPHSNGATPPSQGSPARTPLPEEVSPQKGIVAAAAAGSSSIHEEDDDADADDSFIVTSGDGTAPPPPQTSANGSQNASHLNDLPSSTAATGSSSWAASVSSSTMLMTRLPPSITAVYSLIQSLAGRRRVGLVVFGSEDAALIALSKFDGFVPNGQRSPLTIKLIRSSAATAGGVVACPDGTALTPASMMPMAHPIVAYLLHSLMMSTTLAPPTATGAAAGSFSAAHGSSHAPPPWSSRPTTATTTTAAAPISSPSSSLHNVNVSTTSATVHNSSSGGNAPQHHGPSGPSAGAAQSTTITHEGGGARPVGALGGGTTPPPSTPQPTGRRVVVVNGMTGQPQLAPAAMVTPVEPSLQRFVEISSSSSSAIAGGGTAAQGRLPHPFAMSTPVLRVGGAIVPPVSSPPASSALPRWQPAEAMTAGSVAAVPSIVAQRNDVDDGHDESSKSRPMRIIPGVIEMCSRLKTAHSSLSTSMRRWPQIAVLLDNLATFHALFEKWESLSSSPNSSDLKHRRMTASPPPPPSHPSRWYRGAEHLTHTTLDALASILSRPDEEEAKGDATRRPTRSLLIEGAFWSVIDHLIRLMLLEDDVTGGTPVESGGSSASATVLTILTCLVSADVGSMNVIAAGLVFLTGVLLYLPQPTAIIRREDPIGSRSRSKQQVVFHSMSLQASSFPAAAWPGLQVVLKAMMGGESTITTTAAAAAALSLQVSEAFRELAMRIHNNEIRQRLQAPLCKLFLSTMLHGASSNALASQRTQPNAKSPVAAMLIINDLFTQELTLPTSGVSASSASSSSSSCSLLLCEEWRSRRCAAAMLSTWLTMLDMWTGGHPMSMASKLLPRAKLITAASNALSIVALSQRPSAAAAGHSHTTTTMTTKGDDAVSAFLRKAFDIGNLRHPPITALEVDSSSSSCSCIAIAAVNQALNGGGVDLGLAEAVEAMMATSDTLVGQYRRTKRSSGEGSTVAHPLGLATWPVTAWFDRHHADGGMHPDADQSTPHHQSQRRRDSARKVHGPGEVFERLIQLRPELSGVSLLNDAAIDGLCAPGAEAHQALSDVNAGANCGGDSRGEIPSLLLQVHRHFAVAACLRSMSTVPEVSLRLSSGHHVPEAAFFSSSATRGAATGEASAAPPGQVVSHSGGASRQLETRVVSRRSSSSSSLGSSICDEEEDTAAAPLDDDDDHCRHPQQRQQEKTHPLHPTADRPTTASRGTEQLPTEHSSHRTVNTPPNATGLSPTAAATRTGSGGPHATTVAVSDRPPMSAHVTLSANAKSWTPAVGGASAASFPTEGGGPLPHPASVIAASVSGGGGGAAQYPPPQSVQVHLGAAPAAFMPPHFLIRGGGGARPSTTASTAVHPPVLSPMSTVASSVIAQQQANPQVLLSTLYVTRVPPELSPAAFGALLRQFGVLRKVRLYDAQSTHAATTASRRKGRPAPFDTATGLNAADLSFGYAEYASVNEAANALATLDRAWLQFTEPTTTSRTPKMATGRTRTVSANDRNNEEADDDDDLLRDACSAAGRYDDEGRLAHKGEDNGTVDPLANAAPTSADATHVDAPIILQPGPQSGKTLGFFDYSSGDNSNVIPPPPAGYSASTTASGGGGGKLLAVFSLRVRLAKSTIHDNDPLDAVMDGVSGAMLRPCLFGLVPSVPRGPPRDQSQRTQQPPSPAAVGVMGSTQRSSPPLATPPLSFFGTTGFGGGGGSPLLAMSGHHGAGDGHSPPHPSAFMVGHPTGALGGPFVY